jgi:transcriptional regulator with XRE-family HTH domain
MVKSLKERLAEKRAAQEQDRPPSFPTTTRPASSPCVTCGVQTSHGAYCLACRAQLRSSQTTKPKENKPVSTPITVGNGSKPAATKPPAPSLAPERIKSIRKASKLTQVAFGERIGVTGQTIANWESGHYFPSATNIQKILDIEWESVPPPIEPPTTVAEPLAVDADARRMAEAQNLSEEEPEPERVIPEEINASGLLTGILRNDSGDYRFVAEPCGDCATDLDELAEFLQPAVNDHKAAEIRNAKLRDEVDELKAVLEQERAARSANHLRDNLDAFRLLVRTFGIDTADRIVDLLRA